MLSLEEAQKRILTAVPTLPTESIPLSESCGRVAADNLTAHVPLPGFDNSAMDGYAVRAEDVAHASTQQPVILRLVGTCAAGGPGERFNGPSQQPLSPGECFRIYTGAPLPPGADAVVMQEDTATLPTTPGNPTPQIAIHDAVKPWENIRFQGEDVAAKSTLLETGSQIGLSHLALLAATGHSTIRVGKKPRVAVLASGSELIEPGQPLPPGCIYESNRTLLAAAAQKSGASVTLLPLVRDSLDATVAALRTGCEQADVLLTSGGVSVGDLDFLKEAFERLGGSTTFWKVAIKPGKPFTHGRWGSVHWFGLPGNPVSAFVTYLLLVHPALVTMQGGRHPFLPTVRGRLTAPLHNRGDRRHWVRVHLNPRNEVKPSGPQASHRLHSLALANGLVEVPPDTTLPAGQDVPVILWEIPHF